MSELGKVLILFGILLIVIGVFLMVQTKLPTWKLPGDIFIRRDGLTIYIPIATSILLSILLTILINILLRK